MRLFLILLLVTLVAAQNEKPTSKTKRATHHGHGHTYGPHDHYYHLDIPADRPIHNAGNFGSQGVHTFQPQNSGYHNYDHGYPNNHHTHTHTHSQVLGTKVHTHTHSEHTITKEIGVPVPKPYPVTVEKRVPVPVPQPYPVHVHKPVPVRVEVRVPVPVPKPYPVTVTQKVPVQVPVYVKVPHPVRVEVPVPQPYPVHVEKRVPVEVKVPVYVKVPVPVSDNKPHIDHIDIHHTGTHNSGHNGIFVTGHTSSEQTGGSNFATNFNNYNNAHSQAPSGFVPSGFVQGGNYGHNHVDYAQSQNGHNAHIDFSGY